MKQITISCHQLVDLLLRSGHIDSRVFNASSMAEGTRLHQVYQKKQNEYYLSEVPLKGTIVTKDYEITVEGRADGIIISEDRVIIDEIKTTVAPLKEYYESQGEWHLGQAKVYAYLYAEANNLDEIMVRLTYISQKDESQEIYSFVYKIEELTTFFKKLITDYLHFMNIILIHQEERIQSLIEMTFPYDELRQGQKEMIETVSSNIKNNGCLILEAPTGTGKTVSALFGALSNFGNPTKEKIFYLTAKNSIKVVALETIQLFIKNRVKIWAISLASKEKMCLNSKAHCNPDECPFARFYYDKTRTLIPELLSKYSIFNEGILRRIGEEEQICPFELALDLSVFMDIIIADYNHVFNPFSYLQRYFNGPKRSFDLLVDEAHNLVSRSREMYSESLSLSLLYLILHEYKTYKKHKIVSLLSQIIDEMKNLAYMVDNSIRIHILTEIPLSLLTCLEAYTIKCKELLKEDNADSSDNFLAAFHIIFRFINLPTSKKDGFTYYFELDSGNIILHIKCLDARLLLRDSLKNFDSVTFFSATLTPLNYYKMMLGGDDETDTLALPSPFKKENCLILVNTLISTYYKNRSRSCVDIATMIKEFVSGTIGNYMVFFPSFEYMEMIYPFFCSSKNFKTIIQTSSMSEEARQNFLNEFLEEPSDTLVAFCVLGGVFSEGIDLVATRLIGACIVGVGLPSICFDNDQLKDYYNQEDPERSPGFDYAYVYPGFNKVQQAVGRVIRSELDRGVVLLIDSRYESTKYLNLFKPEWSDYQLVYSATDVKNKVKHFWEDKK